MHYYEVSMDEILTQLNPLNGKMWKCAPIDIAEVMAAIKANDCELRPWSDVKQTLDPLQHRSYHIRRIAFLASSSAEVDKEDKIAIGIVPDSIWIYDGNHRVAAAIVRGKSTIKSVIASYDDTIIPEYFPSARKL